MSRSIKSWPSKRDKCYYVRLGPVSEVTGKPIAVMLKDEAGRKVELGDEAGRIKAVGRLIAERDERERRESGPTVAQVIDQYIEYHEKNRSAKNTIKDHQYRLTRFGRFAPAGQPYANRPAASLRLRDLTAFRKSLEEVGNQTGSLKLWYGSILACWRWAARPVEDREPERLIPENPFEGVPRPSRGDQLKRYVSPYVADLLIRFAEDRVGRLEKKARRLEPRRVLAFKLIALSGARPFEAAALEWKEIDWAERVIKIEPRPRGRAKTRKGRTIAIPDPVYDELQALRDHPENDPRWVFAMTSKFRKDEPTSRRIGIWFNELRDQAIAAGIPVAKDVTLYYFRHAWQTIGMRKVGVAATAAAAGNSPGILLSTYDQTQNEEIRQTADLIARAARAEVERIRAEVEKARDGAAGTDAPLNGGPPPTS